MKTREELLELLNAENGLENLKTLLKTEPLPPVGRDVNNHIHTTYSFSPYSPTAAVWFARAAGLCTCGLMDHDSIAGSEEFLAAAKEVGMGATIGLECRVSFKNTPFGDRRLNNPDQDGVVYMALHGVPHNRAAEVNAFFAPYRAARNERNRKMVAAVNQLMGQYGVTIDFEKDVLPLSNYAKGGSVTERHISSALAYRMLEVIGKGETLVKFIRETMQLPLSDKIAGFLCDEKNPHMMYDLLGWIKSTLIAKFYIDATDELPRRAGSAGPFRKGGRDFRVCVSGRRGRFRHRRQAGAEVRGRFPGRAGALPGGPGLSGHHLHAFPEHPRATEAHPRPVRQVRPVPDFRRGHQFSPAVLRVRSAARAGIRQSVRSHLGADRSRMAFHQESRRRAVLQGERRPVARPFRPGEGLLRLRSGNVQIIHTTRRRKNRRFFQNRRGMSK